MTTPRYVRMPDGRLVAVPTPVPPPEAVEPITPPEPEVEEEAEPRDDGFSEILDVTEEDIIGTEGVALPEEEDNEDLFGVPEEEDMGGLFGVSEPEEESTKPPKPKKPKIRRTTKYYPPPPTTLGGMRQ